MIKSLVEYGMVSNLIRLYIASSRNASISLQISKFLIYCVNQGKRVVQQAVFRSLVNDTENSFMNAASENIRKWFKKFKEREHIRTEFYSYAKAYPSHVKKINDQINIAIDHLCAHLKMMRFLSEGHFLPMQEFMGSQFSNNI